MFRNFFFRYYIIFFYISLQVKNSRVYYLFVALFSRVIKYVDSFFSFFFLFWSSFYFRSIFLVAEDQIEIRKKDVTSESIST